MRRAPSPPARRHLDRWRHAGHHPGDLPVLEGAALVDLNPCDRSGTWGWRFIGSTLGGAAPALPKIPVKDGRVHAVVYNDLQFEGRIPSAGLELTIAINNTFDPSAAARSISTFTPTM